MGNPLRLALIIGMDVYNDNNLDQLTSCKKDALDLSKLLTDQGYTIFGDNPVIGSRLDKEDGWGKVREFIGNFFAEGKPSQTLLFYFSGHGIVSGNDVYLATSQIEYTNPWIKGISLSDLTKQMDECRSKQIVGIIDACYSGATNLPTSILKKKAAKDNVGRALATYDKIWKNTPKSKGISLLLSSRAYEPSIAVEASNSLYTKFLLKGLQGIKPAEVDENGRIIMESGSVEANGDVTPKSLHDYLYYKVGNMAEQTPEFKSDQSSNIVLTTHPVLALQTTEPNLKREDAVDLSKWVPIHNGGTDVAGIFFTVITAMETSLALHGEHMLLSVRYLYEKAKKHDEAEKSEGTMMAPLAYVIQYFGVPPESAWPYKEGSRELPKGTSWRELDKKASKYKARVYFLGSVDEILEHLRLGRTVVAAVDMYAESCDNPKKGEIPYPKKSDRIIGKHVITIVGYDPRSLTIRFANSWSKEWGDNGFASISRNAFQAIRGEMFAVEVPTRKNN